MPINAKNCFFLCLINLNLIRTKNFVLTVTSNLLTITLKYDILALEDVSSIKNNQSNEFYVSLSYNDYLYYELYLK